MSNSLSLSSTAAVTASGVTVKEADAANRCRFYLPNKRRYCANSPLPNSKFCGNHDPSSKSRRVPCPIDPSHSVFVENLDSHVKRCPLKKQVETLERKPYYSKGINAGVRVLEGENASSEAKRRAIYEMNVNEFSALVGKIRSFHSILNVEMKESFVETDACKKWINQQVDRQLPYQEKHVMQQVSIIGNMEVFGIVKKPELSVGTVLEEGMESDGWHRDEGESPAVIEFGAGRGYLTHMLADCYAMKKIILVERRSYKLKADRSLRQKENISLERLRIDIEDLDLDGIESLKGHNYLAIGKHLCGPATDLAIRCCLPDQQSMDRKVLSSGCQMQGLALATCCHHLCQWNHYINTNFMSKMGVTKKDFDAVTWFSSWAVDGDHSSDDVSCVNDQRMHLNTCREKQSDPEHEGVEQTIRNMQAEERAAFGFMCKDIIDVGRLLWLRDHGLDAQVMKYVPSNISPENHLLVAKCKFHQ